MFLWNTGHCYDILIQRSCFIRQHCSTWSCCRVLVGECCTVEAVRHLRPVILRCLQDSPRSRAAPWCHKLCAGWRSCLRENNYQVSTPCWHQLHWQHKVSLHQTCRTNDTASWLVLENTLILSVDTHTLSVDTLILSVDTHILSVDTLIFSVDTFILSVDTVCRYW